MSRSIESLWERGHYPLRVHRGRDIDAGHLRGWGLEFSDLHGRVEREPMFQRALRAACDRGTLLPPHKLANLYLIIRHALPDGADILEFGSYQGGSAVFMATLLRELGRDGRVFAFDTFAGMPPTDPVRDLHSHGDFGDSGYAGLLDYIATHGLGAHLRTVQGLFDQTLPGVLSGGVRPGLLHIDCDIYEPIGYVIRTCLPQLLDGTHIVLDDPLFGSCLGAFDAVQEVLVRELGLNAEQVYPHLVYRYPPLPEAA